MRYQKCSLLHPAQVLGRIQTTSGAFVIPQDTLNRSCTSSHSSSAAACPTPAPWALAISAVTLPASCKTLRSVASINRYRRVSQSCIVIGILEQALDDLLVAIRSTDGLNPGWRTGFRQEKGPGDYPSPCVMVEPGGIEPPSASPPQRDLHTYSGHLVLT